jgi:hypothetical protein
MKPLFDPGDPLLKRLIDRQKKLQPIRDLWPQTVGETAANHSQPVNLEEGVLTVWVDSSLWATKLRHLGPSIVAKLNLRQSESRAGTRLSAISIRVSPSEASDTADQKDPRKHLIHQPVDRNTTDLLASVASSVKDEALRASMLRLCEALKNPSANVRQNKKTST